MTNLKTLRALREIYADLDDSIASELHRLRVVHLGFEEAMHLREAEAFADVARATG